MNLLSMLMLHKTLIYFLKNKLSIKLRSHRKSRDFLTPKKKQQENINEKAIEEPIYYEVYESADSIKEIKHYMAEARRGTVKRLNTNPRNEHRSFSVPEWAFLSVTAIPRRPTKNCDGFQKG